MVPNEKGEGREEVTRRALEEAGLATDAEKIAAEALHEPKSVAGLRSDEDGSETDAEKIAADQIDKRASS